MKASENNRFIIAKLQRDLAAIIQEFHEYQHEVDRHFLNLPEEKTRIIVREIEMDLPDHLRLTYDALRELKRATAQEIANVTKRARANESMILHFFEMFDLVTSERLSRKKIYIFPEIKH